VSLRLSFLGGAGTVTGSKYLIENAEHRLLIDCGLFQGFKTLRLRNWERFPVDPHGINAVLLTHAHLDHTGYLPLLIKHGFAGPVFCSGSTADFCEILLPDSGHLQEKDAEFANRHGFSKHKPALPLYTLQDAFRSLKQLKPIEFEQHLNLPGGASAFLRRAGHILGAASIQLDWSGTTVVFSGDLGRPRFIDPPKQSGVNRNHPMGRQKSGAFVRSKPRLPLSDFFSTPTFTFAKEGMYLATGSPSAASGCWRRRCAGLR